MSSCGIWQKADASCKVTASGIEEENKNKFNNMAYDDYNHCDINDVFYEWQYKESYSRLWENCGSWSL